MGTQANVADHSKHPPSVIMNIMPTSSPHTADGDTPQETPSTNLTIFSPDTIGTVNSSAGAQPNFKLSVTTDGPVSAKKFVSAKSNDDVFLNEPASANASSQLSPVAEAFTPSQLSASSNVAPRANPCPSYITAGSSDDDGSTVVGKSAPVNTLLQDSVPDNHDNILAMSRLQIQESQGQLDLPHNDAAHEGVFSTDESLGRALLISNVDNNIPEAFLSNLCRRDMYPSLVTFTLKNHQEYGVVLANFTNVTEAAAFQMAVRNIDSRWGTRRISPKQFHQQAFNNSSAMVTDYEGQVIVTVFYDGHDNSMSASHIIDSVKVVLAHYGYLKAFHALPMTQHHTRQFHVEFEDTVAAERALANLQFHKQIHNIIFMLDRHQPDVIASDQVSLASPGFHAAATPHPSSGQVLSITGRSLVPRAALSPVGHMYQNGAMYGGGFNSPPRRGGRDRYEINGSHNQVVINKIQEGLDVRTTIMLRNIPNKVDSAMLKGILDETSLGDYDFMYLRIDFANNCNVGYAFINFVDALAIVPFAKRRAGQRWNRYGSDKVAEISYATIQGKDCLVQKFRNSSVMLEDPSFRPKLFYTGKGPGAGEEEPFPRPDNLSKMRRSVENAEHVGLFTPTIINDHEGRTRRILSSANPPPHMVRAGTYQQPARAKLPSYPGFLQHVGAGMASRITSHPSSATVGGMSTPSTVLTPKTSEESLGAQASNAPAPVTPLRPVAIDVERDDDPFVGSVRRHRPFNTSMPPQRLFAPRQGQAYREEQRRRRSQFDRGTPGAEYEAHGHRLTDPARSPTEVFVARSARYQGNGHGIGSAYDSGMPGPRLDSAYY